MRNILEYDVVRNNMNNAGPSNLEIYTGCTITAVSGVCSSYVGYARDIDIVKFVGPLMFVMGILGLAKVTCDILGGEK